MITAFKHASSVARGIKILYYLTSAYRTIYVDSGSGKQIELVAHGRGVICGQQHAHSGALAVTRMWTPLLLFLLRPQEHCLTAIVALRCLHRRPLTIESLIGSEATSTSLLIDELPSRGGRLP